MPNTLKTDTKKPPANQIRSGDLLKPSARETQAGPNSALTSLETRLGLVDDISPATAANHAVIAVTTLEGLERIDDFHRIYPSFV
jgi:hypothetical protein